MPAHLPHPREDIFLLLLLPLAVAVVVVCVPSPGEEPGGEDHVVSLKTIHLPTKAAPAVLCIVL